MEILDVKKAGYLTGLFSSDLNLSSCINESYLVLLEDSHIITVLSVLFVLFFSGGLFLRLILSLCTGRPHLLL